MASGALSSDHAFRHCGDMIVSFRFMQAMCCLSLTLPAAAAWAQAPAKSDMIVGAIVVKPCLVSSSGSKNLCNMNIRKTKSDVMAQIIVADSASTGAMSKFHASFVEYEF
ncbi:hypothetical protein [Sphingobium sp. Leaf26]|uniref:hypothetical protein n=1 Tax=Sphingobium sp. Leaf26 TaxID=1735693 RepID=UPI0012E0FC65|nr:hypothetical protein [Sphingobium sp. Leaf26]